MRPFPLRRIIIAAGIFAVLCIGAAVWYTLHPAKKIAPIALVEVATTSPQHAIIGSSVEGQAIDVYTYGDGATHLAFVGGIHGGYEWNSVLLAYEFMDYLSANPEIIPKTVSISIIPSANPDGVYKIIGKEGRFTATDVPTGVSEELGRLNADGIDLNRNFDCKWQPESMWRGTVVDAGSAPFSEPEARAIRDFVLENNPVAVVFWHSQSNAVYASECENGILPKTLEIMNTYAHASGYPAVDSFTAYKVTGDAEGWLASIGIPAITVELETHKTVEWEKNLAGITALLELYK
ncbi:MAG: M14 family metallopeptidase [Candidatus Paceibacterota bacterium]|jgi:predicted deacylase